MIDWLLFLLRIISAGLLIALLLTFAFLLWRETQVTLNHMRFEKRSHGSLIKLIRLDGQFSPTGEIYPLMPLTSLGRAPSNTIVLNNNFTSSEHALIALRGGQWWLEDRQSRNGTQLNGETIKMPTIITHQDIVSIGELAFQMTLHEEL
jgi:hypothetical protein